MRLKAMWAVQAGIIIGERMPEHDRVWNYTDEDLAADTESIAKGGQPHRFAAMRKEALEYAGHLQNPSALNWVSVRWIWV